MRDLLARLRRRREHGTIMPLVIGFGVIIILLLVVVTDASQLWVYQRGLHSIADGASLEAANSLDPAAIYDGGVTDTIELNQGLAQAAVNQYVQESAGSASSGGVTCTAALVNGGAQVTVTCNGHAQLPIVGFITNGRSEVPVSSAATAQTFSVN